MENRFYIRFFVDLCSFSLAVSSFLCNFARRTSYNGKSFKIHIFYLLIKKLSKMRKTITLKSLLMAAALLLGANSAWAGDKTVVKYSFDDAVSPSLTAGSRVSFDYDKTSVITSTKFLNAYNNANGDPGASTVSLGSTDLSDETWTLSFEWAACGGCNSKPDHTTLKAGDNTLFDLTGNSNWNTTVTITYTGSDGTKTLPVPGCNKSYRFSAGTGGQYNTTTYWHNIVVTGSASGVKMTIRNSDTGVAIVEDIVLSETNVSPTSLIIEPCCGGAIGLDELSLSYYVEGEVIQTPIANYTAVNGISRTITATCDTDGADIYYSTDGETYNKGAVVTVDASGKIYFKGVKGTSESDVLEFDAVAGEAITLNAPIIDRSDNTTVTITAVQTNLLLSPTATIYYEYGEESGSFTGSKTLTVAADATITAYAEAAGYETSATSERAVALFPVNVAKNEETATKTSGWSKNTFSEDTKTVSERTYAALLLDGEQWGKNVYLQTDGAWGLRATGNWYIDSNTQESWMLFPSMKAGDIIVVNVTYPASSMNNATFSKYSFGTRHAYEVTADGDVELAFKKISAGEMDYLYGVYAYRLVTSVSATVTAAGWATFVPKYNVEVPAGVEAYYVTTVADGVAKLAPATAIPAEVPVLLKNEGEFEFPVVASAAALEGNKLAISTGAEDEGVNDYVLYNGTEGAGFYKWTGAALAAGKVYLPAAAVSGARDFIGFTFGDATAIKGVESAKENGAVYNLAGQRVAQPTRGLYIVNGKKFVVK